MAEFKLVHLHIKTPDPKKIADYYVDALGAKIEAEMTTPLVGYRLDLHGVTLNVSKFVDWQSRVQDYGFEHIAISTDDPAGVIERVKANGGQVLEEITRDGRTIYWGKGPDGVGFEILQTRA